MKEGTEKKGGRNSPPKTARPTTPPPAQPPAKAPEFLPLAQLRPPLPKLDSITECVKCRRGFCRSENFASVTAALFEKQPGLQFCIKADVFDAVAGGKTYEGEHMHRTCPYCNYGWIERTA